jgi:hypothetical protein
MEAKLTGLCQTKLVDKGESKQFFYFKTWQYRSKTNWVIPKLGKSEAKRT